MRSVLTYIRQYALAMDKRVFALVTVYTAVLIFLNYHYHIDDQVDQMDNFRDIFFGRYLIFFFAFIVPYAAYALIGRKDYFRHGLFVLLAVLAPAIFALKASLSIDLPLDPGSDIDYWNKVVYWPFLLVMMLAILWTTWTLTSGERPLYGFSTRNMKWRPYAIMLLIMVPLIAIASTQADFQHHYPKIQNIAAATALAEIPTWKKLLFEISYGSDFVSIELFFRGFLVIAFVRWAGRDAILPMACFYCTIHFGKPMAECISSYFGGMLLGILVYNTRSILGGLMVHLGIAWMMEAGGFIGNFFFHK